MNKLFYEELPAPIKPMMKASNARELLFENPTRDPVEKMKNPGFKSSIRCVPATGSSVGRSYTLTNVHASEAAFWPRMYDVFTALFQAVPAEPGTSIIVETTPNGFNEFKKFWDDSVAGNTDFIPLFFPWYEDPDYRKPVPPGTKWTAEELKMQELYGLDDEQLSWRRWCITNNMAGQEEQFKQEYPSNPEEAFLMSGNPFFDNETVINRMVELEKEPKLLRRGRYVYEEAENHKPENWRFVEDPRGEVYIYAEPERRIPYVVGGDTAGDGSDRFTAHVIDNTTCMQCAQVLYEGSGALYYAQQVYCLGMDYNRALLGVEINYLTAMGHYASQEAKLFNSSVFGSYNGEHYSLHAAVTFNNLSNFENGGLQTVADLNSPLQPEDLPVLLSGMSGYRYISGFLNHSYSIGMETERVDSIEFVNDFGEKDKRDTIIMEYTPLITFAHDFETNNSVRRYIERTPQAYFPQSYYNQQGTHDSTNVLNIVNTLSVTFEEAFNKVLRFGATVYARNECQRYMGYQRAGMPFMVEDLAPFSTTIQEHRKLQWMTDTLFSHQWTNNTFIGGSIYKKTGRLIRYDVTGDVCLAGYKIGEFNVDGHIDAGFRVGQDSMTISARAFVRNETPSWYLQHFESNHFRWDNDFGKTYRFYVGGRWAYPTTWVKPAVDVGFENITRYIYFDKEGMAQQHEGNIQVISADAQVDLTTPWINLENHVVYQHSSSDKLPLPTICLYHNLYYHGSWAHKAMDAQIGVDMRYFTRYYAPMLNPATGQFCVQDSELIGNYPVLNVYASFYVHLLQLRFFAQYTHINHLFMRDNLNYMTMPSYPMNPDVFRAGLSWHFLR